MTVSAIKLDAAAQREMVEQVRELVRASPLVRPVTSRGQPMKVRITNAGELGWTSDGDGYRYTDRDSRGAPWPAIPESWRELADSVVEAASGKALAYPWDCAHVVFYDQDASLGWHRDVTEADRSWPIVTFSLGDACAWATRAGEHSEIVRTRLESGDITLLAGRTRDHLHTVERIIPAPLFSPIKPGRLVVSLRIAGRGRLVKSVEPGTRSQT